MPSTPGALDTGTTLAVERTWLAYERTMMAWVRTATSLISFGFTIYKFFQFELGSHPPAVEPLIGPREFALLMIGTGLIALALAFIGHQRSLRDLHGRFHTTTPRSVAGVVAGLVSVLGLVAFVAVVFRQ